MPALPFNRILDNTVKNSSQAEVSYWPEILLLGLLAWLHEMLTLRSTVCARRGLCLDQMMLYFPPLLSTINLNVSGLRCGNEITREHIQTPNGPYSSHSPSPSSYSCAVPTSQYPSNRPVLSKKPSPV